MSVDHPQPGIFLTERAQQRLVHLQAQQPGYLRVAIEGGGCAGFKTHISWAEQADPDDYRGHSGGAQWIMDPISAEYLNGATLNFVEDLTGSRFELQHPSMHHTCGCGASFSIT